MNKTRLASLFLGPALVVAPGAALRAAAETPPLPRDLPIVLPGHDLIDASRLAPYDKVSFATGPAGKAGPLARGERVEARAYQTFSLERRSDEDGDVFVRRMVVSRPDGTELARAAITLDASTLAPLRSSMTRGGQETAFEYDWREYVVRQTSPVPEGQDPPEEPADLMLLEAGAHETWIAALPWRDDLRVMIPTILAGGGGKWWAVPRVVGSEEVDIGDGVARDAWVIELDWWGMGKDQHQFTPGGGVNGTAGAGGKYWVLKAPPAGTPAVIRIRTERDAQTDSVMQLQSSSNE